VHHLPPGISKWHKIAPRLFSYISQNWRATPPVSYRVIVGLISATTTKTGLAVHCELDGTTYSKGITVSDEEMDTINITRADFHSEWNYIIRPGDRSDRAADSSQALSGAQATSWGLNEVSHETWKSTARYCTRGRGARASEVSPEPNALLRTRRPANSR
jgi:hypothetical protein